VDSCLCNYLLVLLHYCYFYLNCFFISCSLYFSADSISSSLLFTTLSISRTLFSLLIPSSFAICRFFLHSYSCFLIPSSYFFAFYSYLLTPSIYLLNCPSVIPHLRCSSSNFSNFSVRKASFSVNLAFLDFSASYNLSILPIACFWFSNYFSTLPPSALRFLMICSSDIFIS
jgi:hypothetical protein